MEESQRTSMLSATQQVALHVKALSGDLIAELQKKATIDDTQQLFDAMHKQFVAHKEAHRALFSRVEAQGVASEQLADEASTAALQAAAALRGSEQLSADTRAWVTKQLDERPTRQAVEGAATAAAEAALRTALSGEDGWLAVQQQQLSIQTKQIAQQQAVLSHTNQQIRQTAQELHVSSAPELRPPPPQPLIVAGPPSGPPINTLLAHVREILLPPLESRIEALELGRRRLEVAVEGGGYGSSVWLREVPQLRESLRDQIKEELLRKLPSLEQVETLQATLSTHIQRLPHFVTQPHGRWTWTSGRLRASAGRSQPPLLPWTSERLNNAPKTFGWTADRAYIEILASGMYVIACAVFVPGGPTIGVTVNGQTVLRRISSTRQVGGKGVGGKAVWVARV